MAQNIIYSPWERTKGSWLCLMTTLLLFSLLWLFSFVLAFLISLIKLILWLKFSTGKRQAEDMVGGGGKDHRVLFHFICYDKYVHLAKLCYPLPCFILYYKDKLAYYSRYLLTSFFFL